MKKILLIFGGVVGLLVLAGVVYFGYPYFLLYLQVFQAQRQSIAAYQKHLQDLQQEQQGATNQPAPPQKMYKAVVKQGPVLVNDQGYKNEDNWIAASISREIADMAFLISSPGQPVPDFKVSAEVDLALPKVHVEITGSGNGVSTDLTPVFAWDGSGYAPLARQLLGTATGLPSQGVVESTDVVTRLLNLTGAEIANEDVLVSGQLQQFPASWGDHETAALVLVALALRENAGGYSDNRILLNRATAHLAMAKALRGDQPETWPGLIAEAAMLTLSGRELDALATLDALGSRPDCTDSAKVWITALRLTAKQNWRLVDIQANSPLLLKILWFQVAGHDLFDMVATHQLDKVLSQDSASPESKVPDWGRAIIAPDFKVSVENSQRFTVANMTLEFQELDDVLKIEGAQPADQKNLAATFSESEGQTVALDATGKPVTHVIGAGTFKAATRRHLFNDLKPAEYGLRQGLGLTEQAGTFHSQMKIIFRGVPQYEFAQFEMETPDEPDPDPKNYSIEEAPVGLISQRQDDEDNDLVKSFYGQPTPFGTAYQVEIRSSLRRANSEAEFYRNGGLDSDKIRQQITQLPSGEQADANKNLDDDLAAHPEKYYPPALSTAEKAMLKLAPYQISLAIADQVVSVTKRSDEDGQWHLDHIQLNSVVEPFLDHNLRYLHSLETWEINDTDHEMLLRKEVLLEPDAYFALATILRVHGKEDEAAEMDRKGVVEAYDQVGMANSVRALLLYDLDHGLNDEALSIGKRAADVYSYEGLESYMIVLAKLGRFDEAEQIGKQIEDRYQDDIPMKLLYIRNKAHYPDKYDEVMRDAFPNGLVKADLSSFSGKPHGAIFGHESTNTLRWDIHRGDVIVALDGYKVESELQYMIICAFTFDPHMDIILWKNQQKYVEVKALVPARRFYVDFQDY